MLSEHTRIAPVYPITEDQLINLVADFENKLWGDADADTPPLVSIKRLIQRPSMYLVIVTEASGRTQTFEINIDTGVWIVVYAS